MTLFRGYGDDLPLMEWLRTRIWPAEARLTEEDVYHGTRLALLEMIRGGTTYLNDMYWHRPAVCPGGGGDGGPRRTSASVFIDLGDTERAPEQRESVLSGSRSGTSYGPRVRVALGPHAIYTVSDARAWSGWRSSSGSTTCSSTSTSPRRGRRWTTAWRRTASARRSCCGALGLVGPRLVAAHGVWLDDDETRDAGRRGRHGGHEPSGNLKLAVGGIFDYAAASAAGLRVVLGTDGAARNNNLDLIEEMKVAALVQKHRARDGHVPAGAGGAGASRPRPRRGRVPARARAASRSGRPADLMLVDLGDPATQPGPRPVSAPGLRRQRRARCTPRSATGGCSCTTAGWRSPMNATWWRARCEPPVPSCGGRPGSRRTRARATRKRRPPRETPLLSSHGPGGTRTHDPGLKRPLLCQLSYRPAPI